MNHCFGLINRKPRKKERKMETFFGFYSAERERMGYSDDGDRIVQFGLLCLCGWDLTSLRHVYFLHSMINKWHRFMTILRVGLPYRHMSLQQNNFETEDLLT